MSVILTGKQTGPDVCFLWLHATVWFPVMDRVTEDDKYEHEAGHELNPSGGKGEPRLW